MVPYGRNGSATRSALYSSSGRQSGVKCSGSRHPYSAATVCTRCSQTRMARVAQAGSPVASPAARNASTMCMLLFAPRYGSGVVKPRSQDSMVRPAPSSQNRLSTTSSASSSSSAAPGRPATVALLAASTTKECG